MSWWRAGRRADADRVARSRARRLLLAQLLFASALCLAPKAARADDAAMSRFYHEQGSRFYAAGRFDLAVREFMAAERLSPNPRTVFNIGLCFLRMSRNDDAFFFLQEYLDASDDAEGVEERRRFATSSLEALMPRVARVAVRSTPEGASIFVDQREHGSYGETPRVLALSPGRHRVWVELVGHERAELEVEAVVGREVVAALEPALIVGSLVVDAPAGSRVALLDASGAELASGDAPLRASVPPGRVEIVASAEGYRSARTLATVVAGEESTVPIELERLPAPTGDLTVTTNIGEAVVELDGTPVGFAPVVLGDLAVDGYDLRVHAPGYVPWTGRVDVEASSRSWMTVDLVRAPEEASPWPWIVGGAGLAALVVGAVLGGLGLESADAFHARWNALPELDRSGASRVAGVRLADLRDRASALGLGADVSFGVGVAALGGAVILFVVGLDGSAARVSSGTLTRRPR